MMYLFSWCKPSVLLTLLAKRMLCYVSVPDALPRAPVPFTCGRVALIFVVSCVHFLLVFLTVSSVRQLRTAGIAARALGFSWHSPIPHAWKKPSGHMPQRLLCDYHTISCYQYSTDESKQTAIKPPTFICRTASVKGVKVPCFSGVQSVFRCN